MLHATETGINSGRVGLSLPSEIKEIENQPRLKNFNLNINLTSGIYVPSHPTPLRGPQASELSSLFSFHSVFQTESEKKWVLVVHHWWYSTKANCYFLYYNPSFLVPCKVYVVVQFYPWFKLYFVLFLGMVIISMVMYDNEFETKENKI